MKGEFEKRLRQVIDEVQASPKPIILFIDEAHTLVGAGGAAGTGDAANLLKPALARGTLRTVGRHHLGRIQEAHREGPGADAALPGRCRSTSPSEEKAILMMRGMASTMEKHHRVQILDEALEAAVQAVAPLHSGAPAARQVGQPARHGLRARGDQPARRAGRGRGLPHGASRRSRPSCEIIGRETAVGIDIGRARRPPQASSSAEERERLEELEARWEQEKAPGRPDPRAARAGCAAAAGQVEGTGSKLEAAADAARRPRSRSGRAVDADADEHAAGHERAALLTELQELQAELAAAAGRDAR